MDSTFRDFIKALDSSRALYLSLVEKENKKQLHLRKPVAYPRLKFKSWKDNTSSLEIRSRTIMSSSKDGLIRCYPTFFKFKKGEGIPFHGNLPTMDYSVRLQRTRNRKYYLCIPALKTFAQTQSNSTCAIDPGVRDFLTIYDPAGLVVGIKDGNEHIFNRCMRIDRLQSRLSKETSKRKRYRMRKHIYNIYQRMKHMINDVHQKMSKWLADNYKEVLLPKFETSEMTSKQKRISSKTSRAMLTWSHYKFRMMLTDKMERAGGRLILCNEYYTSKTCSRCGTINNHIKRQKTFDCKNCKVVNDRDVNAARNIYLMNEHLFDWTLRVQGVGKPTSRCQAYKASTVL
jgi:IS605 OrfB family transposase